ncbi:MAG: helix-turn-helix domain-containing protein [Planctomycetota bacterium]|jgi:excisionase family DNA binding protein
MSEPERLLPPENALLDAAEAGALLKVTRSTVLRWAAAGEIAYSRIGGKTLFLGADLRAFVRSRRRERRTLGQKVGEVSRRCR